MLDAFERAILRKRTQGGVWRSEVSKKLVSRALVPIVAAIPSQEFARRIPNAGFRQV
jgi:hypothetical protein